MVYLAAFQILYLNYALAVSVELAFVSLWIALSMKDDILLGKSHLYSFVIIMLLQNQSDLYPVANLL